MAAIYPHSWTSAMGDDPNSTAGDTWAKGLTGLSAGQLAHGLEACITRNNNFPPVLAEFRALCMGVPSLAQVKAELLAPGKGTRSGFLTLMWRYIDAHAFRRANQFEAGRILADAYDVAREQAMRGVPMPHAIAAVKHEQRELIPSTPDVVEQRMGQIRELLHVADKPEEPVDVPRGPLTEVERELQEHYDKLHNTLADTRAHAFGDDVPVESLGRES